MTDNKEKEQPGNNAVQMAFLGPGWVRTCIEGILFISEEPVKARLLSQTLGISEKEAKQALEQLADECIEQNRGFVVRRVSGGYRFYSNPAINEVLRGFVKTNIRAHLSQAALETLAIAAYRQPVTRTQIAEIRGVRTDSVVLTLVDRGLLKDAGKLKEPGSPVLYRTTDRFLELLGINSLKELPPLADFKEDEEQRQD